MATATTGAPLIASSRLVRRAATAVDVRGLASELRRSVEGEVRFDDGARALYATDASNYRQIPLGVVLPRSKDDVVAAFAACRSFGAPIVSRAGGTGLCGQTTNAAVVIDWSKYMNRIVALDPERRVARVQPGVICDDVVHAGRPFGLTYGPRPATHDHCCFGGMLANNSCGIYAQMAGKAVDNTEEMEILLYDGTRMQLGWMDEASLRAEIQAGGRRGAIYAKLARLRDRYADLIRARYPKIPRRVSGYNLDSLLPGKDGRYNLARALVGSEGTCVAMLEMTVRLVHDPPSRALVVLGYPDVYRAADHLMEILEHEPIGLEAMDARIYEHVRTKHDPHEKYLGLLPPGFGWLFAEFGGETDVEAREKADALAAKIGKSKRGRPSIKIVTDPAAQHHVWLVRESGLGATAFVPGDADTWEGWEDSAVAPEDVGAYLRDLRALWDKYGYDSAMYGHFGMGCIHCRVSFDLTSAHGIARWRRYMDEATDLVAVRYRGSISGEHGDGQSKAEFLEKMFGPELVGAFREFKAIWDPDSKMNPGKIVDPYRIDENLRLGPSYSPEKLDTHFKYPDDGGSFAHATLRCVGIGKCRRRGGAGDQDTMCPSFMVTREEEHSTRGRAHLLFEMQRGAIKDGWRDEHVKEALDLCLSCKGCKGDCPVNVDVATYKAEFLAHYWKGRLRPRSAYAFGLVDQWARLASLAPGWVNLATQLPIVSALAKTAAGASLRRRIPAFAAHTFQEWFAARAPKNEGSERVVLWADTFNDHFTPEVAAAATSVLEDAGFRVVVPGGHLCCGRPLYDYGMLDLAKRYLERVMRALRDEIRARTPIVVLEPSCASVFRDELRSLFPDHGDAQLLGEQVVTLSELLTSGRVRARGWSPPHLDAKAIVQGHCHHKAIMKLEPERRVLEEMGLDVEVLESGCCGMAGSFGYEKEKIAVSLAAGERVLLPRVREADKTTLVVADGFSCRTQIEQETDRGALHLAEVLALAKQGRHLAPYPERTASAGRRAAQRRSMVRAGIGVALLLGLGALGLAARALRPRIARRLWS